MQTSLDARVSSAIAAHPHLKQRKLHLEAADGRVVLRGVVNTYYQKQMAQEVVRHVHGVERIDNHLEVDWATTPI